MKNSNMKIFSGQANQPLAKSIANNLSMSLGNCYVDKFSDGETQVEIRDNVRGHDVFVVQPTCAPTNDNLMELMLLCDALMRSSAVRITAVIPYFGYQRQDRRPSSARVPISAKVIANMLSVAGVHRVLTMDLHADQIQGFFDVPLDNIYSSRVFLDDIAARNLDDICMVSPDVGGVVRARAFTKRIEGSSMAIIDKRRPKANVSEVMHIIGEVEGKNCILVDDMADTAGTLCQAADALKEKGAKSVFAYCTHPVLSGKAENNLRASSLDELVVADTIPVGEKFFNMGKVRQLSIAPLFAETIRRIHNEESISYLFN